MHEWKRIFSDRRRRAAMLCIPLLCIFYFFFAKCYGRVGWLFRDAEEYRALLEAHQGETPEQIIEAYPERWTISENERRILAQAEHLRDYGAYLERIQKQAVNMQATSLFNENLSSFVYRNILKTAEDFADCTPEGIRLGNDRAMQYWLNFTWADWGFLAAILLLVMSYTEERKKGLAAIVRTCPSGRGKLQGTRLLVLLGYSAGMTLLLYYIPLALSLCVDGGWSDLARPVQSLVEFRRCTAQLTVAEFLLHFFFVKTACGVLLGVLIWFLLGFLEQVQLSWLLTAAGLAVEYMLYTLIPAQSIFNPLRKINVFSYVFTSKLYTQYENINFFNFPVEQRTFLLGLLAVVLTVLGAATVWVLTRRFPFGNRDRLGKWLHLWNRAGDAIRRRMGLFCFEWYKLLFLGAGGIFLVLGLVLSRNVHTTGNVYDTQEDAVYRQYVAQVEGPVTQETYHYIAEARQSLESSGLQYSDFQAALDRLERTADSCRETGAWIVDENAFLNVFGEKSWWVMRKDGMTSILFLVLGLAALFATEQSGDVRKVLRSAPGGRERLFRVKYLTALSVTVLVWLWVFAREWHAVAKLLGDTILKAPCSSIAMLKGLPMTVKTFLTLVYVVKGLALLIPMHVCLFVGERSHRFELGFLVNGVAVLLPAAAYCVGVDEIRFLTPVSLLTDINPMLVRGTGIVSFAVWTFLALGLLLVARRHWSRTA